MGNWRTRNTQDTSAVLVYSDSIIVYERTVENTECMENWRTVGTCALDTSAVATSI